MKSDSSKKRSVTTEQAIKMLSDEGLEINEKEAEEILDFLYFLAKLTVNQLIKSNSKVDLYQPDKQGKAIKSPDKIKKP
jgi:hypothetical protein